MLLGSISSVDDHIDFRGVSTPVNRYAKDNLGFKANRKTKFSAQTRPTDYKNKYKYLKPIDYSFLKGINLISRRIFKEYEAAAIEETRSFLYTHFNVIGYSIKSRIKAILCAREVSTLSIPNSAYAEKCLKTLINGFKTKNIALEDLRNITYIVRDRDLCLLNSLIKLAYDYGSCLLMPDQSLELRTETNVVALFQSRAHQICQDGGTREKAESYLRDSIELLKLFKAKLESDDFIIKDLDKMLPESSSEELRLIEQIIKLAYNHGSRQGEELLQLRSFQERVTQTTTIRLDRSATTNRYKADEFARNLIPVLDDLRNRGITSLEKIASELNDNNVPCSRNGSRWYASSVKILKDRIKSLQAESVSIIE